MAIAKTEFCPHVGRSSDAKAKAGRARVRKVEEIKRLHCSACGLLGKDGVILWRNG